MNKIIPFNKEIKFNDLIGEITNIALEDTLKFKDSNTITGDLIVKGSHKYGDIEEDFSYPVPTIITVDDKYNTSEATIKVDDFYYEIINDDTLKVKIDLILDNLSFKEIEDSQVVEEDTLESDKEYSVYRVYTVLEGDTLNKILDKFNVTSELLSYYNNLEIIKPGIKLIIPSVDE